MSKKTKLFILDANIGAGKTTALDALEKKGFKVLREPLDVWKGKYSHLDGNLFDNFYKNKEKWSFAMQVGVMTSRIQSLVAFLKLHSDSTIIVERSIFTDRNIFGWNLFAMQCLNIIEMTILKDLLEVFVAVLYEHVSKEQIHHIYLKADPEVCFSRKENRKREAENMSNLPPKYIIDLDEFHTAWFNTEEMKPKTTIVDGNLSEKEVLDQLIKIVAVE